MQVAPHPAARWCSCIGFRESEMTGFKVVVLAPVEPSALIALPRGSHPHSRLRGSDLSCKTFLVSLGLFILLHDWPVCRWIATISASFHFCGRSGLSCLNWETQRSVLEKCSRAIRARRRLMVLHDGCTISEYMKLSLHAWINRGQRRLGSQVWAIGSRNTPLTIPLPFIMPSDPYNAFHIIKKFIWWNGNIPSDLQHLSCSHHGMFVGLLNSKIFCISTPVRGEQYAIVSTGLCALGLSRLWAVPIQLILA